MFQQMLAGLTFDDKCNAPNLYTCTIGMFQKQGMFDDSFPGYGGVLLRPKGIMALKKAQLGCILVGAARMGAGESLLDDMLVFY